MYSAAARPSPSASSLEPLGLLSGALPASSLPFPANSKSVATATCKQAVQMLVAQGFHQPTKAEREAVLVAYARRGKAVPGAAYDVLKKPVDLELGDAAQLQRRLNEVILCEVKSSNRAKLGADLKGYMFNITAGELLVAQSLGKQYKFIFVNVVTGTVREMALQEVFSMSKGIYPAFHIKF